MDHLNYNKLVNMKILLKILLLVQLTIYIFNYDSFGQNQQNVSQYKISVNLTQTSHVMAGGIGASWHAMGATAFYYPNLIVRHSDGG